MTKVYGFLRNETEFNFEEQYYNETSFEEIETNSWPWAVYIHITKKDSEDRFCNGVIIHPRWILIPGRCATTDFSHGEAQLGGTDREDLSNFEISQVYRHENFSKSLVNDIALAQLKDLIHLSPEEFPICIYKDYGNISTKEIFLTAGWGSDFEIITNNTIKEDVILTRRSEIAMFTESNILRERMLSKSDEMKECIDFKGQQLVKKNSNDYICTHGTNNQGFKFEKGASLMLLKNGEWILTGLLSRTEIKTIKNNRFDTVDTTLFTRIENYCDWIRKTTLEEVECSS